MRDINVLMPVKYPAPWLEEAIDSIEDQTCTSWHGILVIHGEFDGIQEMMSRHSESWELVRAPAELNLAEVLNLGLSHCTAEFVARMDADDVSKPSRFELQLDALRRERDIAMTGSSAEIIDGMGRVRGRRLAPTLPSDVLRAMRWKCAALHSSVMFRREVIARLGGYRATSTNYEDYDLWLRLLESHSIQNVEECLVSYRVHVDQVSGNSEFDWQAWASICQSRIGLARARDESVLMARVRHAVWLSRQFARASVNRARSGVLQSRHSGPAGGARTAMEHSP
jgi:glycosyltransferase involved in cell wall biosynthesis